MRIFTLLLLIIVFSCKTSSEKKEEPQSTSVQGLETQLDSLFNAYISPDDPGAALMVAYNGEMLVGKGYGIRDLESKASITKNTNMRMASVSKQFTNLSLLTLMDQGKLSLNDTVYKFWPLEVFKNITVTQLINHTSGLADYEEAFKTDWDRTIVVENKDILHWLGTNPTPRFDPGEKWEYSNTAYIVLALLTEKLSGRDFAIYAKEAVFEKAGMKNTNYYSLAHPIAIKERSFCYEKDSLGSWKKVDGFFLNGVLGDGAVYTSITDFYAYDQALRNRTILSDSLHQIIFKPSSMPLPENAKYKFSFLNGAEESYGMGWFITDDFALHTGSWNGTRTIVVRNRNKPLTIAIFMNSGEGDTRSKLIEGTYKLVEDYLKN